MRLWSSRQTRQQSSQALIGAVRPALGFFTWLLTAGYWTETSVPCHMDLSMGLLMIWLPPEQMTRERKRTQDGSHHLFRTWSVGMSNHNLCDWSHRPPLVQCGRVWIPGETELLEATGEAAYYKVSEMSKGKCRTRCWVYCTVVHGRDLDYSSLFGSHSSWYMKQLEMYKRTQKETIDTQGKRTLDPFGKRTTFRGQWRKSQQRKISEVGGEAEQCVFCRWRNWKVSFTRQLSLPHEGQKIPWIWLKKKIFLRKCNLIQLKVWVVKFWPR